MLRYLFNMLHLIFKSLNNLPLNGLTSFKHLKIFFFVMIIEHFVSKINLSPLLKVSIVTVGIQSRHPYNLFSHHELPSMC